MQIRITHNGLSIRGEVTPGLAESAWAKNYIEQTDHFNFRAVQLQTSNKLTQISRLHVDGDDGQVVIKAFGLRRHIKKFRNFEFNVSMQFRNYARSSYKIASRMLDAGILTPQPVAWWSVRRKGRCLAQYYMYRFVDQVLTLSEYVNQSAVTPEGPAILPILIDEYAQFVARIHKSGFRHGDLAGGNILVTCPGERRYYLIDLEKSKVTRGLGIGRLFEGKDFKRINLPIFKKIIPDPHGLFVSLYKAHRNSPLPDAWHHYWLRQR